MRLGPLAEAHGPVDDPPGWLPWHMLLLLLDRHINIVATLCLLVHPALNRLIGTPALLECYNATLVASWAVSRCARGVGEGCRRFEAQSAPQIALLAACIFV